MASKNSINISPIFYQFILFQLHTRIQAKSLHQCFSFVFLKIIILVTGIDFGGVNFVTAYIPVTTYIKKNTI